MTDGDSLPDPLGVQALEALEKDHEARIMKLEKRVNCFEEIVKLAAISMALKDGD